MYVSTPKGLALANYHVARLCSLQKTTVLDDMRVDNMFYDAASLVAGHGSKIKDQELFVTYLQYQIYFRKVKAEVILKKTATGLLSKEKAVADFRRKVSESARLCGDLMIPAPETQKDQPRKFTPGSLEFIGQIKTTVTSNIRNYVHSTFTSRVVVNILPNHAPAVPHPLSRSGRSLFSIWVGGYL
ncbi:hypothetical protein HK102_003430 [Quaeritorhiza haematococci]|nr:hypothetical protein HK102_003430 [Quaeritorhiza haematococci]